MAEWVNYLEFRGLSIRKRAKTGAESLRYSDNLLGRHREATSARVPRSGGVCCNHAPCGGSTGYCSTANGGPRPGIYGDLYCVNATVSHCRHFLFVKPFIIVAILLLPGLATYGGTTHAENTEPFVVSAPRDLEAVECLKEGHEALEKGDIEGGINVFEGCLKRFPRSPIAHYWMGRAYFYGGKDQEALAALKTGIRLDPGNMYILRMLGEVYSFDKSKLNLAEDLLNRVLQKYPHYADARFNRACVYAQRGEFEKAFAEFRRLLAQEIKLAKYHTELGRILATMGRKDEAKQEFNRALTLASDYVPAKKALQQLNNSR